MKYDPQKHHRRSIRLKGYDYTRPGAYFITLVAQNREPLFGEIVNGEIDLNEMGTMIQDCWKNIPRHFPLAILDEYILMPNHFHGILFLKDHRTGEASAQNLPSGTVTPPADASPQPPIGTAAAHNPLRGTVTPSADASPRRPIGTASGSIGAIIQSFKSVSTRKINQAHATPGEPLWQRNYYEHIVRDQAELDRIRQYILDNPLKWEIDRENPNLPSPEKR